MERKFEALCKFIEDNSTVPELAERAVELLQDFVIEDDKRWSTLAPLDPNLENEVAKALNAAAGDGVEMIIFVSLTGEPINEPGWIPCHVIVDSDFGDNIDILNHATTDSRGPMTVDIGKDPSYCGNEDLACRKCCPLHSDDISDEVFEELRHLLNRNLGHEDCEAEPTLDYLHTYLTFVILGCQMIAQSLEPLVKVLPRAVPYGTKYDEPGVWLVLCR